MENNNMEIEEITQTRKRGRPFGSVVREPGHARTVHVPQRVKEWLDARVMKLSELVSDAPKWYDRMLEQSNDLKLLEERERCLEEERSALRRAIAKLNEENADLMRFRERVREKMAKRGEKVEA